MIDAGRKEHDRARRKAVEQSSAAAGIDGKNRWFIAAG
jgi:hypothetical protein